MQDSFEKREEVPARVSKVGCSVFYSPPWFHRRRVGPDAGGLRPGWRQVEGARSDATPASVSHRVRPGSADEVEVVASIHCPQKNKQLETTDGK